MLVPARLELVSTEATLRIHWPDGRCQSLDHSRLRAACRCAACRSKRAEDAPAQAVRVVGVEDTGYGIQIVFDDGHDRGIYPWAYLQTL
ncbi:DUF971 domain-containing protein (plasmid) [Cupriavidus sp. Agwp_2]|nr:MULTISPECIES: gamma-butyrobetaine hydroxylase-like domain-containing protein [unclassified Cupriavidus]